MITPLSSPLPLIQNNSCIDPERVTKIFISGFNRDVNAEESKGFISTYLYKGGLNVIYLDWAEEAKQGNWVVLGYIRAVINTEKVANQLATALMTLSGAGLNLDKVHVIGHSLGAQISGITGSKVRSEGGVIARVTALDPAKPLYEGLLTIKQGVNNDSAKFVDVIHSDPGGYGISESAGTADFWPNYEDKPGLQQQPGCPSRPAPLLSDESLCSHVRSVVYFLESITICDCFLAAGEPNYETWIQNNGESNSTAYMGEYVSLDARGNYYLVTNDRPPYSKGQDGTNPKNRVS
ncbi:lipase member H-like [Battus philenor]|uniref:lipase member H-like n=1 Tax=Battus philenor TaxID=42288 RepID=UPI0035D12045